MNGAENSRPEEQNGKNSDSGADGPTHTAVSRRDVLRSATGALAVGGLGTGTGRAVPNYTGFCENVSRPPGLGNDLTIQELHDTLPTITRVNLGDSTSDVLVNSEWTGKRPDYENGIIYRSPEREGKRREYENGIVYSSEETGAHIVWTGGPIWEKWEELGGEQPRPESLRYPLSNRMTTSDGSGKLQYFQGGVIYWSSDYGTIVIRDLPPNPRRPVLFKHKISRQGGDQKWCVVDRSIENLDVLGAKNEATSLYVPEGWSITIFDKTRFRGRERRIVGPQILPQLQDVNWSDSIASVKVNERSDDAKHHYCNDARYPYGELTLRWVGVINNGEGSSGGLLKHGPAGNLHIQIYDGDQVYPGRQSGSGCCAYPKSLRHIVLTGPGAGEGKGEWDDGLEKSFRGGPLSLFRWRSADDAVTVLIYESDPDTAFTNREHDPLFFKRVTRQETLDTTKLFSGVDGCDDPDKNCGSTDPDTIDRARANGADHWLESETGMGSLYPGMPNMFMKLRTDGRAKRYHDRMNNDDWDYRQTFLNPRYKGYPLDRCKKWGEDCGKPALEKWAKRRFFSFNEVVDFKGKWNEPPTKVINPDKLCDESFCDTFQKATISLGR